MTQAQQKTKSFALTEKRRRDETRRDKGRIPRYFGRLEETGKKPVPGGRKWRVEFAVGAKVKGPSLLPLLLVLVLVSGPLMFSVNYPCLRILGYIPGEACTCSTEYMQ